MSDLFELLAQLKAERALVEEAIVVMRKLVVQRGRASPGVIDGEARRGRPKGSKNRPKQPNTKSPQA